MYESIYIYTHTYIDFTHIYKCSSNDFCALCALCALCSFFDLFLEKKLNKINYLKKGAIKGRNKTLRPFCQHCALFAKKARYQTHF
mgnify:CR=1 FL=1